MKKPAWKLIDWTDLNNYEHLDLEKNPSDEVFAWEFLRRNPQYQNDFAEYERTQKFPGYTRYILTGEGKYISRYEDMLNWYGLSREFVNIDPKIATLPVFVKGVYPRFFQKDDLLELAAITDMDEDFLETKQDEIVVVLSTSQSLGDQFDRIKDQLKSDQDKNSAFRRRREKYLTYLRLLDADLLDAPEDEVLKVLYPNEEKPRTILFKNLTAAKKMRDYNYRRLLAF